MKALGITRSTCVGMPDRNEPENHGNCFGVKADNGASYNIANFNLENLEALLRKGLTWPIEIKALGDRNALIHDPRIGERWYQNEYCEICTPRKLLPAPQLDRREREILRGAIVETDICEIHKLAVRAEFP